MDLCPFDDQQIRLFLNKRFEGDAAAEGRAHRVLQRIASSAAPPGGNGRNDDRIEQLPYVVLLAAESADTRRPETLAKYGDLFSTADPIRGLLLAICERERERQRLEPSAEEQLYIFGDLVAEFEADLWTSDELELCCQTRGHSEEEARKLRSHWFLFAYQEAYGLEYPFIGDYLRADVLCQWLREADECPRVDNILRACVKEPGNLLDQVAMLAEARLGGDALQACRARYIKWRYDDQCLSGFFHCVVAIVKRIVTGTRRDHVDGVLAVFGLNSGRVFHRVSISGALSNLDFCGVIFQECVFSDVEFTHCKFDAQCIFERCECNGQFNIDYCEGFTELKLVTPSRMSPSARASFSDLGSPGSMRRIDNETILEAMRDILRWFSRGPGLKAKKKWTYVLRHGGGVVSEVA